MSVHLFDATGEHDSHGSRPADTARPVGSTDEGAKQASLLATETKPIGTYVCDVDTTQILLPSVNLSMRRFGS